MEVFIATLGALVLGLVAWRAYEFTKTRRRLRTLSSGQPPSPGDASDVEGHPRHGGWHFFEKRADGDERYERWAYRATVQRVLPGWLMMDYCPARPATRPFLPEALFGREATEGLPEGWHILAEDGDLSVQSDERYLVRVPSEPLPEVDALAARLARAYLGRGLEALEAALEEAVDVQGEAEALRLLCLQFPHRPRTRALAEAALEHEIAAVRVVAARHLGRAGHPALRAVALDPELPAPVRREACRALASREDHEALLEVAMQASAGVEDVVAEALAGWPDPRVEGAVLPFLDVDSEVVAEAAANALAQRGSAASVSALRARLLRRPGPPLRTALKVAIDLIQERAGGERGGLAIAPEAEARPEPGRVSLPGKAAGRLSEPTSDDEGG